MRDIKTLTFVWIFAVNLIYSQPQDCTGWFGSPCVYKCRCTTPCQPDGTCTTDGSCQLGWFGPACQYADLALSVIEGSQIHDLIDGDERTCNTRITSQTVTLTWNQTYLLTWLRVYTKNMPDFDLTVQFRRNENTAYLNVTCHKMVTINNTSMDIFCDLTVPVKQVVFIGKAVQLICSVYISGGRNVALRQQTSQSSTYIDSIGTYGSDKAVDGDNSGNFTKSCTCSFSSASNIAYWYTIMPRPVTAYRYVVYNRRPDNQYRLLGFHLRSFNVQNVQLDTYTDISSQAQSVYTVIPKQPTLSVSSITITVIVNDFYFTVCEVEIYGETECVTGRYGRECENTCNCANTSEPCYVSTGGCLSGCADGFHGENCNQACPDGMWGISCKHRCDHCASNNINTPIFDRFNGDCLQGCQDGYISTSCNQPCSDGRFGKDCLYNCHEKCVLNSHGIPVCDNTNGTCLKGCQDGYIASMCNQNCPSGKYGAGCVYNCSKFCAPDGSNRSTCQHTDGFCPNRCLPGYDGARCDTECSTGTFGKDCRFMCAKACLLNKNIPECDHITGACECQNGYTVPWCNQQQVGPTPSPVGVIVGAVLGSVAAVGIIVGIVALMLWHRRKTQTSQNVRDSRPNVVVTTREGGTTSEAKLAEQSIMEITKKEPKSKRTDNTTSGNKAGVYYNTISDPSSTPTQVNDPDTHVYDEITKQEMDL